MKTPKRINIIDGRLKMADGSSLRAYLKEWQKKSETPNGTHVNITRHTSMVRLIEDANLSRGWAS